MMLRFERLEKRFGSETIFQGLTQRFDAGCIALLGDNGSGKSTLINILAGRLAADHGEVWIDGHSLSADSSLAHAKLASVPDDCMAFPVLTGRGLFEQAAAARGGKIGEDTMAFTAEIGAAGHLDHRFEQMSLGTRKKMYLAALTIGEPSVIVADEPSNGLDASAVKVVAAFFKKLSENRVVLFSTHDPRFADACGARTVEFDELKS